MPTGVVTPFPFADAEIAAFCLERGKVELLDEAECVGAVLSWLLNSPLPLRPAAQEGPPMSFRLAGALLRDMAKQGWERGSSTRDYAHLAGALSRVLTRFFDPRCPD